jgi:hypothetical protein
MIFWGVPSGQKPKSISRSSAPFDSASGQALKACPFKSKTQFLSAFVVRQCCARSQSSMPGGFDRTFVLTLIDRL